MLQNLSIPDIQNLCNTSKRFKNVCRDPEFEKIIRPKIKEEFVPLLSGRTTNYQLPIRKSVV